MDKLYAPWRNNYVKNTKKKDGNKKMKNECVFCHAFEENNDQKNLILKRYNNCVVMINKYPYNAGHLLILPFEHKAELEELKMETRNELMQAINDTLKVIKKVMNPQGFNVGLNLGSAGGGGIPSHLHFHILPRWNGDTNYLATLGQTKVICSDFYKIYDDLKKEF